MGDLGKDTALQAVDEGRYKARLSQDWEIWGPMGGYVASVALRAAGEHCGHPRPASFYCHYLSVAAFDEVDVTTTTVRAGKRTASVRVSITQQDKPVLEALVWAGEESEGMEHEFAPAPDIPDHEGLKSMAEIMEGQEGGPPFRFWDNLDEKPPEWLPFEEWQQRPDVEPVWKTWFRFKPAATFDDAWTDACRSLIVLDLMQWPAASRGHRNHTWMAPSLDLFAAFHRPAMQSEWLLGFAESPSAGAGLVGGHARVWDSDRRLVASGGQQMLCRPAPQRPPG